jgi:hypothetical protein
MPAPKGDVYWAKWAYNFCQVAKVSLYPNRDYGKIVDMDPKSVAGTLFRLRERGFMVPKDQGNLLTEKSEQLLKQARFKDEGGLVAFDLRVRAKSKVEALSEVWDVITQLESWDPSTGEAFRLKHHVGEGDSVEE